MPRYDIAINGRRLLQNVTAAEAAALLVRRLRRRLPEPHPVDTEVNRRAAVRDAVAGRHAVAVRHHQV